MKQSLKRLFYFVALMALAACSIQQSGGRKDFETAASEGRTSQELNSQAQKVNPDECWVQSKSTPLPDSGKYTVEINNEDTQVCPLSQATESSDSQ